MRGLGVLLRRFLAWIATMLATSLAFGALLWVTPGSPGRTEGGPNLLAWLFEFWSGALRGELGPSYRGLPITDLVLRGLGQTVPNLIGALAVACSAAVILHTLRRHGALWWARPVSGTAHMLSLCPGFLLGYLALVVFAVPPEGVGLRLAAILVLALGDGLLSDVDTALSAEVDAVLDRDFVDAARLRGDSLWPLLVRHTAMPMAQLLAGRMAFLLGGVLVLEMVLGIQGLGLVGYRAARHGDFPLLLAITVVVSGIVGLAGLALEALRFVLDPRARAVRRPELPWLA